MIVLDELFIFFNEQYTTHIVANSLIICLSNCIFLCSKEWQGSQVIFKRSLFSDAIVEAQKQNLFLAYTSSALHSDHLQNITSQDFLLHLDVSIIIPT